MVCFRKICPSMRDYFKGEESSKRGSELAITVTYYSNHGGDIPLTSNNFYMTKQKKNRGKKKNPTTRAKPNNKKLRARLRRGVTEGCARGKGRGTILLP